MDEIPFSIQELWESLKFLACREDIPPEKFVSDILQEIHLQEEKMNEVLNLFSSLDEGRKKHLLSRLGGIASNAQNPAFQPVPSLPSGEQKKYLLGQLKDLEVAELVKRKPRKLWINNAPHEVKNWKEVTVNFARALISQNLLSEKDLPFYPNPASGKAYVNSEPRQPVSTYNGLFEKIKAGFYVDIKHNAKYHILNIWRTLEKLGLQDKWNVELELRD